MDLAHFQQDQGLDLMTVKYFTKISIMSEKNLIKWTI